MLYNSYSTSCLNVIPLCIYPQSYMHDNDTYQLFLFHALHENDEEMLGLCAAVGKSLLNGHQQLVSQRFIDDAEKDREFGRIRESQDKIN